MMTEEPANIDIGLRHTVEITRIEADLDSLKFNFRRMMAMARAARKRGKKDVAKVSRAEALIYMVQWRLLRSRRDMLRADRAAFLNGARVLDQISQVMDGKETE